MSGKTYFILGKSCKKLKRENKKLNKKISAWVYKGYRGELRFGNR